MKPCKYCGDPSHEATEPSSTCIDYLKGVNSELVYALQRLEAMASMILSERGDEGKVLKLSRAAILKSTTP